MEFDADYQNMDLHRKILIKKIIALSKTYNNMYESNYLVVSFEDLSGLVADEPDVYDEILRLMRLLYGRINGVGLIEFLYNVDKEARIDITGHFLSGIHNIDNNRFIKNRTNQTGGFLNNQNNYSQNKKKYKILCSEHSFVIQNPIIRLPIR